MQQISRYRGSILGLLLMMGQSTHAQTVVVPNAFEDIEAPSSNTIPFGSSTFCSNGQRYQQVYADAELTNTGLISAVRFRLDGAGDWSLPPTIYESVSIAVSTSANGPGSLSEVFADNTGADVVEVFSGDLVLSAPGSDAVPEPFDAEIIFQTPFNYEGGNLLLDMVFEGCNETSFAGFDWPDGGDISATERAYAGDFEATSRNSSGPGLVTQFQFGAPLPPVVSKLSNISTRAQVGNGVFAVVGGFIITGAVEKCVVVRGRGQSIDIGIARLQDPTLTLKQAGNPAVLEFNDNWQDHPSASTVQALGAQPGDPSEAAFYTCLEPGAYVAELRSALGGALGLGIVEVIDQDSGTSFLSNISTRAEVITGARRVVAGFIIEGNQAKDVLIRGRGPTVNVPRTRVPDPFIQLRQGPTILASNDDWSDAANVTDIQATGAAPQNAKESAILITLPPGAYTVFLQSQTGEPGIGIIEVIDRSGG